LNFLDRFSKYTGISNFVKISPVGAELFHAEGHGRTDRQIDRQTDMAKLAFAFRNVANAPKNAYSILGGKHRLFGGLGHRSEDVK
jgi:hypothetical protein